MKFLSPLAEGSPSHSVSVYRCLGAVIKFMVSHKARADRPQQSGMVRTAHGLGSLRMAGVSRVPGISGAGATTWVGWKLWPAVYGSACSGQLLMCVVDLDMHAASFSQWPWVVPESKDKPAKSHVCAK